ncbi:MAG TPA: hypothetical protein VEP90_08740 [Methylomirabilota bacterium]|nr:hypothetical protein [Methylomirabilota bacterium]
MTKNEQKVVPENGMKAYDEGFVLSDNPFFPNTPDHSIWRDDWLSCAGRFK